MNKIVPIFLVLILICSCGIDSDVTEQFYNENAIELIFPENNSELVLGDSISNYQNKVTFKWNDTILAPKYVLSITNLNTSRNDLFESTNQELTVTLESRTRYSWFVTIPNSKYYSKIWSFDYLGANDDSPYPFPAEAISPASGSSISSTSTLVNLRWKAEDPNNDISGFDIYFGEEKNPPLLFSDIEVKYANDIPVEQGKIYYWKIITKDNLGNQSTSELFNFSVG